MPTKKPILVLGANGFIGSHLVDELVRQGHKVRAFDRFASTTKHQFYQNENIEIFSGDFLNRADIRAALDGVDVVYHLVSTTTPVTAENDPLVDIDTNLHGSVELFQQCVDAKVKHIFYTSSGGTVYGERQNTLPIKETEATLPVSPYGIVKLATENYLRYFKAKYNVDYTIFRLANPYGPRQPFWRRQGAVSIFLDKVINDEALTIFGDGSMIRDYIYIGDAVEMMVAALSGTEQDVYNIGSGKGVSVNEMLKSVEKAVGKKSKKELVPAPSSFVHTSVLDISRYSEEFQFVPRVSIDEGIHRAYQYYLDHPEAEH